MIPQVAKQATHLTVFQRTPNFSVPAQNRPLTDEEQVAMKARYQEHRKDARASGFGVPCPPPEKSGNEYSRDEAFAVLDRGWEQGGAVGILLAFTDVITDQGSNDVVADFIRSKIRETVNDPAVAEKLCPTDHPVGTKRPCVDIAYFETYNRDNVTLVDVRETPIERITEKGIKTSDQEYEFDAIIFAIGFDAMTGRALQHRHPRSRRRRSQGRVEGRAADVPRPDERTGSRTCSSITGPQSPSVLTNMVVSIEQHVEYLSDAIAHAQEPGPGHDRARPSRPRTSGSSM